MSVEFYGGSPGKFDPRTLNRKTFDRWTGRSVIVVSDIIIMIIIIIMMTIISISIMTVVAINMFTSIINL